MAQDMVGAVRRREDLAASVFDTLSAKTRRGAGICRASYSPEENFAHDLIAEEGRRAGLEVKRDAAANTYVTLPGRDRSAPAILMGSHLDSVESGGNYDGAAGVVAGLVALAGLKQAGFAPARDMTVMGTRAEESAWFQVSYIGSRSAIGVLPRDTYEKARRVDTGRLLAEHIAECGGDPEALKRDPAPLDPKRLRAFLELHIEQGPVLHAEGLPIGIGTGIPGNFRHPEIKVAGEWGHVGYSREYRQDAAVAAAALVSGLDALWQESIAAKQPMAFTVGRMFTDPEHHSLTKVAGRLELSLDMRSTDPDYLKALEGKLEALARDVAERHRVTIDLGRRTHAPVGVMDKAIQRQLLDGAKDLRIAHREIPSPASHDAAAFAAAGVPTAMIFVRNDKGSHNPDEHMEIADFMDGTALLAWWLARHGAA
jgi:beta-ureidopropionase / N-carbamoyl-L-amino-acid hydrolase